MIGVVIVTFNRLDKLKVALECFDQQTVKMDYILVVDNASDDGTDGFLKKWMSKESCYKRLVLTMDSNIGGSGGFYNGLQYASGLGSDWIWVSDDDAFPEENAISEAVNFIKDCKDSVKISAVCGCVINNEKYDLVHRRIITKKAHRVIEYICPLEKYDKSFFELNAFSYVGAIINKEKISQVGLPKKNYFIWFDDTEHSLRLSTVGKIFCLPSIRIHHDMTENSNDISWKSYYGIRNRLDMYRSHFPWYVFWLEIFKLKLKLFSRKLRKRKVVETDLIAAAVNDCLQNRFRLHKKYKPGWKP